MDNENKLIKLNIYSKDASLCEKEFNDVKMLISNTTFEENDVEKIFISCRDHKNLVMSKLIINKFQKICEELCMDYMPNFKDLRFHGDVLRHLSNVRYHNKVFGDSEEYPDFRS